jgi:ribosomal protein L10
MREYNQNFPLEKDRYFMFIIHELRNLASRQLREVRKTMKKTRVQGAEKYIKKKDDYCN